MLRLIRRYRRDLLYHLVRRYVFSVCKDTVISGPFTGARFAPKFRGATAPAYLMGMYEREIHAFLAELPSLGIDRVINVGAADGYYAIGLARLLPHAEILAFESNAPNRERLLVAARHNQIADRIHVHGHCFEADFAHAITGRGRTLVFMDIEGGEDRLLQIDRFPLLANAIILMETHDFAVPGCSDRIARDFASSHSVRTVVSAARSGADVPESFPKLLHKWLLNVGSDQRGLPGLQSWMFLVPRNNDKRGRQH